MNAIATTDTGKREKLENISFAAAGNINAAAAEKYGAYLPKCTLLKDSSSFAIAACLRKKIIAWQQ